MSAILLKEPPKGVQTCELHELEQLTYDLKPLNGAHTKPNKKPSFDAQKSPNGPRSLCTVPYRSDVNSLLTCGPRTSPNVPHDP